MIGDTFNFTVGGSGGTVRSMVKVNQDNFGSTYLSRTSTDEIEIRVRHLKETPKAGAEQLERHTYNVNQTVYATDTEPEFVRSAYVTLRSSRNDDVTEAIDLAEGLAYILDATLLGKLFGWES